MNELKKVGNIDRNGDICNLIRKIASKNYRIGEEVYRDVEEVVQLIETYTTKKELEAKEQELEVLKRLDLEFNVIICGCGEPYKDTDPHYIVKERITQLSSQLTNNKEGIENDN